MNRDTNDANDTTRLSVPAILLAVLCCALWGGNSVAVKFTVPQIPPIGCAGLRFLASLPLIAIWSRIDRTSLRLTRDQLWPITLNALLLFVQMAAFNWGTAFTHASRSSVFINIHPFVVAPIAWLWLDERIGWRGWLGLVLAGLGVAVLFGDPKYETGASVRGDIAVIISGGLIGVLTAYQKRLLVRMRPNHLLFWQMAFSLPLFLGYSLWFEGPESFHFTTASVAGLAYQSVLVSGFCFIAWMALLHRYPANQLAAFGFSTPFFGIIAGYWFRAEPVPPTLVAGCVMVGIGLYLVTKPVARIGP